MLATNILHIFPGLCDEYNVQKRENAVKQFSELERRLLSEKGKYLSIFGFGTFNLLQRWIILFFFLVISLRVISLCKIHRFIVTLFNFAIQVKLARVLISGSGSLKVGRKKKTIFVAHVRHNIVLLLRSSRRFTQLKLKRIF